MMPPFGWVGGKSKFAAQIIAKMPPHKLYCEVFAGGLSVLYAKERSKIEVINDANGELINLHKAIRNYPQSLAQYLRSMLVSREVFVDLRRGAYPSSNNIERAAHYLYRLILSFGSQGISFNAPRNVPPRSLWRDYAVWSRRLKGVCIEQMDFERLIETYDGADTFFYLDPPYHGTEDYYAGGHFRRGDHERLREALGKIKGKWLLSYNDTAAVRELYKGYNIGFASARYSFGEKRGIHSELLLANYL
jgi:DNA adenine methylase